MRPRSTKTAGLLPFLFFLFWHPVSAQFNLLYQRDGAAAGDYLGISVAGAGDMDGDGKTDFIIGAPLADPGGRGSAGSAFVYSGATGSLLFEKQGDSAGDYLGAAVAEAGDVDGDGIADFIIGANGASPGGRIQTGTAYVYSGATGLLLIQIEGVASGDRFGWSVAGAGDVNGDGRTDFIIGAPFADPGGRSNAGSAYLFSGATGSLLFEKNGTAARDFFGSSVALAGDVDGDGSTDFIIGAYAAAPGGRSYAGSAYLYSGTTGLVIFEKNGTAASDELGFSVAGAGDMDGDGKADFIIGARFASPGGSFRAGSAYVYSGATGSLLFEKNGTAARDFFGSSVALAGDVDGDGKTDVVIGAPGELFSLALGSAYVYSGATGLLLFQKVGPGLGANLGISVDGAGDVNGDGNSDIIISAPYASPGGLGNAGSVYVYGFTCPIKGDMNADSSLSTSDVMLLLNCVFLNTGGCHLCFADVNC
ncbi:MAG: integrin alpha, partial [Limisphaerales bacterium]